MVAVAHLFIETVGSDLTAEAFELFGANHPFHLCRYEVAGLTVACT